MKPISNLHRNHPRIGKMGAAKGVAQIHKVMLVGQVRSTELDRPVLPKRLAYSEVKSRVRRQMAGAIAVEKTRAIGHVAGDPGSMRQRCREARAKRVALVVIQEERPV